MVRPNKRRRPARTAFSTSGEAGSALVPLRLAVTKGGLGIELERPQPAGFLEVEKLSMLLVGLAFPVDLSGGVARFRHRRGALDHLALTAGRERAVAALAPAMRGTLGRATPAVTLAPIAGGVMIGLLAGEQALAFDLLWAPSESTARWVVARSRALGLTTPSLAAALRALDGITRAGGGVRDGAILSFEGAALALARAVLTPLGARAPEAKDARWSLLEADASGFRLHCDRTYSPPALPAHVVRELELARLTATGDTALAAGDLDGAREHYVALLERSPRDEEIARRLCDLDRVAGGRTDAALATLLELMPAAEAGFLSAELLEATGDHRGAMLAFRQAAERELFGPLASLALLRASGQADSARDRAEFLDVAVARAPALGAPRWARFTARLTNADTQGALADAEHLEAAARGGHARHEVWRRAGEAFLAHGHHAPAVTLFERALRYLPDNPRTVAGLAQSLMAAGRAARGLDLLARAADLAERDAVPAHDVVLALARALADSAGDYPHAVARLRSIPPGQPETLDARGLEGRYRAALGDIAGAAIAFAVLRDYVELTPGLLADRAAAWLVEAARFEKDVRHDARAAERYLAVALQAAPQDRAVLAAFRQVAAQAAQRDPPEDAEPALGSPAPPRRATVAAPPPSEDVGDLASVEDQDLGRAEARVQALSDQLRGDPTNIHVALDLAALLARLGRDLELFALLSAQMEDAPAEDRELFVSHQVAVLERLIERARSEGQASEMALFEGALAALGGARRPL